MTDTERVERLLVLIRTLLEPPLVIVDADGRQSMADWTVAQWAAYQLLRREAELSAVQGVSVDVFNACNPATRSNGVGTLIEERAWFVDEGRDILGVLTFDTAERDWGYVIQGRDQEGDIDPDDGRQRRA